jgi:superfamily I DNA/RNA helicase/RecB family exonuclease
MTEWRIDPEDWPDAIARIEGPQIIVAGPGTGKTEFLVRRFVELTGRHGVPAERIGMLTFSRRAASDLKRRVLSHLDRSTTQVPASTFHSLAFRLLERHGREAMGWEEMPSLLTGPEQVAMVAGLLSSEDPDNWPVLFRPLLESVTFAEEVADFIMRSREHLLSDTDLRSLAESRDDWRALPDFIERYTAELKARGRLDYGSLQMLAVNLLHDLDVRTEVSEQFLYLLVDEYQDTTAAQSEMLVRLSAAKRNITVAADPYQSVYSFRGAELHNVVEFPARFTALDGAPAQRMILTTSFRVPREILSAADRLTAGGELPGATGSVVPAPHAGRVEIRRFRQQSEEAEWIAGEVERLLIEEETPIDRMAVLVRSKRRFLPELSRALERRSLPHDLPDARLVDHPSIRLIFDIVQATGADDNSGDRLDTDRVVRRLLLGPLFAVPLSVERDAYRERLRSGDPWPAILRSTVPGTTELAALLEDPSWATRGPAANGFWTLWNSLPQFEALVHETDRADYRSAWAAFAQVLDRQQARDADLSLADYVDLADREDFEATPLLGFAGDATPRLTLTTLHQSKGLSFDVVFIADASEGVLPDLRRQRSILQTRLLSPHHDPDPLAARRFRLQEEMRLAYTAMTRASSRVVWTATDAGSDDPQRRPSRFLSAMGLQPVDSAAEPESPLDSADGLPVTPAEAEAHLRRLVVDPTATASKRLAAATMLHARPNPAIRSVDQFARMRPRGADEGLIGENLRLSPSQAESYANCPRQYVLSRRLDAGGDAGMYAAYGRLIHDVLEATEREAVASQSTHGSIDDALAVLKDHILSTEFGPLTRRTAWQRKAERLLRSMYETWIRPAAVPVLLEHELTAEIDNIPWRGRADRIELIDEALLRIVDYKSSSNARTADQAASSIQLAFYLLAAQSDATVRKHGEAVEAEFWFPAAKRATKWVAFDPARLEETTEIMADIGRRITDEDWTPVVGAGCSRCSVRTTCPEWPEGRESFTR